MADAEWLRVIGLVFSGLTGFVALIAVMTVKASIGV